MLSEQDKKQCRRRLKIINGQVQGLFKAIDEERYCVDVLTQVAAIQEGLRGVGKLIVLKHLKTCVAESIRSGDDAVYDELMHIIYKLTK